MVQHTYWHTTQIHSHLSDLALLLTSVENSIGRQNSTTQFNIGLLETSTFCQIHSFVYNGHSNPELPGCHGHSGSQAATRSSLGEDAAI